MPKKSSANRNTANSKWRKTQRHCLLTGIICFFWLVCLPTHAQNTHVDFSAVGKMPLKSYAFGYVTQGDLLYLTGGSDGITTFGKTRVYQFSTNEWNILNFPNKEADKKYHASVYLPEFNGIFSLGFYQEKNQILTFPIEVINLTHLTVSTSGSPIALTTQPGVACWQNQIYLIGGFDPINRKYSRQLNAYDPATGKIVKRAPLPSARIAGSAAVDGKLYVFGGADSVQTMREVILYDIGKDEWSRVAELPYAIRDYAITSQGHRIFLMGSHAGNGFLGVFNIKTNSYTGFDTDLHYYLGGLAVHGDWLYFFGGIGDRDKKAVSNKVYRIRISSLNLPD